MVGVYIHIPFCKRKCRYCDFNSYANLYHLESDYLNALTAEMKCYQGMEADSIYIGGGTPSTLSTESIRLLLAECKQNFILSESCEITMEVNPNTASEEKLTVMRESGINRLSIGVQSFADNELEQLGRLHTGKEAEDTVLLAKKLGFQNISLDLMLGIPLQTVESAKNTLKHAVSLSPNHISAYSLIIEEGTPFYDMELPLPDEDEEREIYWNTIEFLKAHGYIQYEISNFAQAGKESHHNLKYWNCEPYIGLGAGAHSDYHSVRYAHPKAIREYIENPLKQVNVTPISEKERQKEYFLLGLRKREGVFYHGEFPEIIADLKKKGLLSEENQRVFLTKRGIDFGNQVFMEFI